MSNDLKPFIKINEKLKEVTDMLTSEFKDLPKGYVMPEKGKSLLTLHIQKFINTLDLTFFKVDYDEKLKKNHIKTTQDRNTEIDKAIKERSGKV